MDKTKDAGHSDHKKDSHKSDAKKAESKDGSPQSGKEHRAPGSTQTGSGGMKADAKKV